MKTTTTIFQAAVACSYGCENPSIGEVADYSVRPATAWLEVCAMCAPMNATVHLDDGGILRFGSFRVGMTFRALLSDPTDPYSGATEVFESVVEAIEWSSTYGAKRALVRAYRDDGPVFGVWMGLPDLDRARRRAVVALGGAV